MEYLTNRIGVVSGRYFNLEKTELTLSTFKGLCDLLQGSREQRAGSPGGLSSCLPSEKVTQAVNTYVILQHLQLYSAIKKRQEVSTKTERDRMA